MPVNSHTLGAIQYYREITGGKPMPLETAKAIKSQIDKGIQYGDLMQLVQNHAKMDVEFDNARNKLETEYAARNAIDKTVQVGQDFGNLVKQAVYSAPTLGVAGVNQGSAGGPAPATNYAYPTGSNQDYQLLNQMGANPDVIPQHLVENISEGLGKATGIPAGAFNYWLSDPVKAGLDVASMAIPIPMIVKKVPAQVAKSAKPVEQLADVASDVQKIAPETSIQNEVQKALQEVVVPENKPPVMAQVEKTQPVTIDTPKLKASLPVEPPIASETIGKPTGNKTFGKDITKSRFYRKSSVATEPPVTVTDTDHASLMKWKEDGMKTPPPETGLTEGQVERFARGDLQIEPKTKPVVPKETPSYVDESGSVTLNANPIVPLAKTGGAMAKEGYKQVNKLTRDLIERVQQEGGKIGAVVGNKARRAVDASKRVSGELQPDLIRLRDKYSSKIISGRKPEYKQLDEFLQQVDQDGVSNAQKLVEGSIKPSTPAQVEFLNDYVDMYRKTGNIIERNGLKRQLSDGTIVDFKSTGNPKFIRHYTPEFYEMLARNDERTQRFKDKIASLNNWTPQKASEFVDEMRLMKSDPDVGFIAHQRTIPIMPAEFEKLPVLRTNVQSVFDGMANRVADYVGYAKEFGQGIGGKTKDINWYRAKFLKENGPDKEHIFNQLVRSLHGINPKMVEEGSKAASVPSRLMWNLVNPVYRAAWKSMSALSNIPEYAFMPKSGSLSAIRDQLKARGASILNRKATVDELVKRGAKTIDHLSRDVPKGKGIETAGKVIEGSSDRAFMNYYLNEAQETLSGAIGLAMEKRIKSGKVLAGDKTSLRTLGFREPEVKALLTNTAKPELWDSFVQRMVTKTTGANQRMAERSITETNRAFTRLMPFQNYQQMTARYFDNMHKAVAKSVKKDGFKGLMDSMPVIAKSYAGHIGSGAGSIVLGALAAGRIPDLGDNWKEGVVDSLIAAGFSPPIRAMMNVMGNDNAEDIAKNLSPLARQAIETFDAVQGLAGKGKGRYSDKDTGEIVTELIKSSTPVTRLQGLYLTLVGTRDPRMEIAERKFYEWNRDADPNNAKIVKQGYDAFRKGRKDFAQALKVGDLEKLKQAANFAVSAGRSEGKTDKEIMESVRASLSNLLTVSKLEDDQKTEAQRRLGKTNYESLVKRDEIIQAYLDKTKSPRKRTRRRPGRRRR